MDALSSHNDLPAFPFNILPVILAILCGWLLYNGRESVKHLLLRGCGDRVFYGVLLASCGLVAILFAGLDPYVNPWGGLDRYFARAVNIVTNGVYGYGDTPTALFPPGYSFLLLPSVVIFGDTRWAFFLTNLVMIIGFALVVREGLSKLGAERESANLLTLLIVLLPNRLLSMILPFSDVPFSLIYGTTFLLLLIRMKSRAGMASALAIGVIGGIATLVRSNGLVTFIPLLIGVIASSSGDWKVRAREALAATLVFLAVLAPWTIRNYAMFGRFVPVSLNAGVNIAIGNNPSHPVTHNSYIDSVWSESEKWKEVGGIGWNEAQRDSFFAVLGKEYIIEHPWDFLSRAAAKTALTFRADSYTFGELYTYTNVRTAGYSMARKTGLPHWSGSILDVTIGTIFTMLLLANNTVYYLLIALTLYFAVSRESISKSLRWVLLLLFGGILAMTIVTFGLPRYKEPLGIALALYSTAEFVVSHSRSLPLSRSPKGAT